MLPAAEVDGDEESMCLLYFFAMERLLIVYSSTSGHTEFVVDVLTQYLKSKEAPLEIRVQHVEETEPADLLQCDILLLASSTWNSTEGLLPPDFAKFARAARGIDLQGKPTCVIGLGDERYYHTCRATAHLMQFARERGGKNFLAPLPIVNEPYDQREKVEKWGEKFLSKITVASS
jgi:flavodoxin